MLEWFIVQLCHLSYKRMQRKLNPWKTQILYIRGTEKQYPRYLLYTEDENVYKRMDDF